MSSLDTVVGRTDSADVAEMVRAVHSRRLWRTIGVLAGVLVLAAWGLAAAAAPLVSPYGFDEQLVTESLQPPSPRHVFGTDDLGRDIFTRVLYGGRVTLLIGIGVVSVASAAGMAVGTVSGYVGGSVDEFIMRSSEVIMAFPSIILAMAIAVALGPGVLHAAFAMVLVWWPTYARLARGEVLNIRRMEYVDAEVAIGQRPWRILLRAIVPNIRASIIVLATVDLGSAIVTAAGLSFLGLGAVPPTPEWGAMVSAGRELPQAWWIAGFPGAAIFSTVLAFNFLGDAVRDYLDPRHRT
ncbi:MAG TPA: ABC transporter permease [bacterium]|nr:ABC transporter permease [bacterium]